MSADETAGSSSTWSREEDKAFEDAIATYPEDSSDRWEKMSVVLPGKTLEEIKLHYEVLVDDINNIESGSVPLPQYSNPEDSTNEASDEVERKNGAENSNSESNQKGKGSRSDQERRKGIAWTEEEHRLFLLGLDKYGKGDWRSISRNFVVTRTPTQVASHAQKYFIRLNSMNKDRRRSSIHDITNVSDNPELVAPPGPITGQTNGAPSAPTNSLVKPVKPSTSPTGPPMGGIYGGQTMGQPVGRPPMSAVGTPVNLPAPGHVAYGVRAPVPGAPVMAYPKPAHR